jgi:hypothetical protein
MKDKNHPFLNLKEEVKSIYIPDIPVHKYLSSPPLNSEFCLVIHSQSHLFMKLFPKNMENSATPT